MFDIGFWELLIIGVVALLVVGPHRLPAVATLAGQWVGRLRRFANHMRSEIQQELETEHLKQVMEEQDREMKSLRQEMSSVRRQAEASTRVDLELTATADSSADDGGRHEDSGQAEEGATGTEPDAPSDAAPEDEFGQPPTRGGKAPASKSDESGDE